MIQQAPCHMADCEYYREITVNADERDLRGVVDRLSDRLIITDRCAFCQHFERFGLFIQKKEISA